MEIKDLFMINLAGFGGGGFYKLAPDLNRIANQAAPNLSYLQIAGIDASGGLTTALSLTGKWLLTAAVFGLTSAELMTVRLTVDGVVIWRNSFTSLSATGISLLGGNSNISGISGTINDAYIYCDETMLIEIETTSDTDIRFQYNARPIT